MNFSVSGNNNGQIVGKDAYYSAMGDKNDVASEILKSQGGGKEFGFDSGLMVEISVQQHMGETIPELKQDITNAGALTSLSSTMNSFLLKTVDMLSDPSFLSGFDVSVSDPLSASAKVNENSGINKPSQFSLDVKQVASAHIITTTEFKPDQPIGKGTLEISLGTYEGKSFTDNRLGAGGLIDIEETDTISTVADKINSANMGVTATIVKTLNGNERLALYSNETGKDHALNIKVAKDDSLSPNNLDSLSYGGENTAVFTEKVSVQNAMFSVNGIDFEYTSNDVKNVMGLDLTITSKTTTPTTISVSQDAKVLVGNVQFFVDNFNGVMDVVSFLDNSTPGEKFQGALHDSKALKDLKQSL
ncbi:flagellar filament capping protein FliD [Photobacterium leiognathi]|nr:flagellar filament capping protein FliD [Photobacterium leiognathi]